jgi:hypothetical protein
MSITDELNELIALHGNCRDALNVTLAKLRQAQDEIATLKEAADGAEWVDVKDSNREWVGDEITGHFVC